MLPALPQTDFGLYGVAEKLKRVGLLNSITYGLIELKVKKVSGQYEK